MSLTEHLVAVTETPQSDLDLATTAAALAGGPVASGLKVLGVAAPSYRDAALADMPRFPEAVLYPIILVGTRHG